MKPYVPRKGDFIAVTFDPQSGHEQRGRRPALVVSNTLFNEHTGLAPRVRPALASKVPCVTLVHIERGVIMTAV